MEEIRQFLNPLARLGNKKSSAKFPFVFTLLTIILIEFYANYIAHDPESVGMLAIFVFVFLIIYFAFRDGIRGGLTAATLTILYYLFIVYSRHYTGNQLETSLETIAALGLLYFIVAFVIGWLKGALDGLIEKEANEKKRLQAVIQQLPLGIAITNSQGIIENSNRQLDLIMGTKVPKGFSSGKTSLVPAKIKGHVISPSNSSIMHVLKTGRELSREVVISRPDGKERTISVRAAPIRNRNKKIFAAVTIVDDITDQKELETRKDDFVNTASHELKTPLTSMLLYFDLLSKYLNDSSDSRSINALRHAKNQALRLQELISDLLDVSRLQTGKLIYRKEDFFLNELIEEAVDSLKEGAEKHTIEFRKNVPVMVYADRFRIYQVLTNLLTNSIKYSPEKSIIVIDLKKENGKAVVSVEDSGIGIEEDQQKKIFEKLYQTEDATRKSYGGLGMGLFISSQIIKRHRGRIWVKSKKGKGSTFYFSLPIKKPRSSSKNG